MAGDFEANAESAMDAHTALTLSAEGIKGNEQAEGRAIDANPRSDGGWVPADVE
jgi:hypothetical protein